MHDTLSTASLGDRSQIGPPSKLAIIGPTYFSYIPTIVAEFRRRGLDVISFDEKHSNRVPDKIFYRLGLAHHRLSALSRYLRSVTRAITEAGCTDVLLTGVEVIDRQFVERLTRQQVRVHFYTWDGAANKGRFLSYLDLLESKGTFDPVDCHRYGMDYIPLFAEEVFCSHHYSVLQNGHDVVFCGTVHSSRAKIVVQLLDIAQAKNLRTRLMLYYHSRRLFFIKGIVSRHARRIASLISDKSFPKSQIAEMFAAAHYVLDVPHPGQSGMTARTFEALMTGSRLLTLHGDAPALLPPSFAERVTIIADISDLESLAIGDSPRLPPLTDEQRYFLSLERFVDQLMAMMQSSGPDQSANTDLLATAQ